MCMIFIYIYIYRTWEQQRCMLLKFRNNEPIFPINCNHKINECYIEYTKMLHNTSHVRMISQKGSLSAEALNAFIDYCRFFRGQKNLKMLFIQLDVMFLAYNKMKLKQLVDPTNPKFQKTHWTPEFVSKINKWINMLVDFPHIWGKINTNPMIVIQDCHMSVLKKIKPKVIQYDMRFVGSLRWNHHWDCYLIYYLTIQKPSWTFNQETLKEMAYYFGGFFDTDKLEEICARINLRRIDIQPNSNDLL